MAKDPAFLFYPSDFLTGAALMTFGQKGKYIMLLCLQHQHGGRLSREDVLSVIGEEDPRIISKFTLDSEGYYFNERLRYETEKRKKYSESRANNRIIGAKNKKNLSSGESYDNHMKNTCSTHDNHMIDTCLSYEHHMENEISSSKVSNLSELSKNTSKINDITLSNNIYSDGLSNFDNFNMETAYKIDEFIHVYFSSNKYGKVREALAISKYMNLETLRIWAEAFNRHLVESAYDLTDDGYTVKTEGDWARHFRNWLKFQNMALDPTKIGVCEKPITVPEKRKAFAELLRPHVKNYTREMMNSFYHHWAQHNEASGLLRWEMEKVWNLEMRLQIWFNNSNKKQI